MDFYGGSVYKGIRKKNRPARNSEAGYVWEGVSKLAENGKTSKTQERMFQNNDELDAAIEAYFSQVDAEYAAGGSGRYDEFGLALSLGVNRRTLAKWSGDEDDPQRRFLVNRAYDRIAHQLISGDPWNDKFTTQKSMKLIEQERFGGYNTKSSVKQDTTIHVKFGEGADEECMK